MRRDKILLGIAAVLATVLALSLPVAASTNPFGARSPAQILVLVSSTMTKAGSVRLSGTASFPGLIEESATLDSSVKQSVQTTTGDGIEESDLMIGSTLYIKGNADDYKASYGITNSPLANQWVLVPSSNSNYAGISVGERMTSLIETTLQMNAPKDLGAVTYRGKSSVAIDGKLPSGSSFPNALQTVYVSTSSPYLPIGYSIKLSESGHQGSAIALFSKWGESVHVVRPATFVTASAKDLP